jgi:hypothetical protein
VLAWLLRAKRFLYGSNGGLVWEGSHGLFLSESKAEIKAMGWSRANRLAQWLLLLVDGDSSFRSDSDDKCAQSNAARDAEQCHGGYR